LALEIIENSHEDKFLIVSDSLSALQAIDNLHFNNPIVSIILETCHILISNKNHIVLFWVPSPMGIIGNEKADQAAKTALLNSITDTLIPYTDLKPKINSYFNSLWQSHWESQAFNKLLPIKPKIGQTTLTKITNRHQQVILHRLRVGHTYLTHSWLLKREDQPTCVHCNSPISVEHILLHCSHLNHIRLKYFNVNNLHELFNMIPYTNIINFIMESNISNLI